MAESAVKYVRAWMKDNGIDAYMVPHADRFQSEYLTPSAERLAWLTGFTGSNGLAIILHKKAALFTDGRYALQAKNEVDTAMFEIVESPPVRPTDFLVENLPPKAKIGFDGWLFTVAQIEQWKSAVRDQEWEFISLTENPIDLNWKDAPQDPFFEGHVHSVRYAGRERGEKIKSVLSAKSDAAGAILMNDPGLVCWLLNIRGRDVAHVPVLQSIALVHEDGHVTLFAPAEKITDAMRQDFGNHVTCAKPEDVLSVLADQKKPVQTDPAQLPVALAEFCREKNIALLYFSDPAMLLRACKNDVEVKGAVTAHEKDAVAFDAFLQWYHMRDFAKENITEMDIAEKLRQCRAKDKDFVDTSFNTIAGFGSHGAIVHYSVTPESNATLKPDSLLLLDSGGQYFEGTTDITRTLAVGTPTAQMKEHYTAVLKGMIALSRLRFPMGILGGQLEVIARQPIWALGLNYSHGTGHGVGSFMSVHEGPQGFSPRGTAALRPGMILSIEPGIYLEGQYGIRLENLVVVIDDARKGDIQKMLAFKTLTTVPFESGLILWDRLDAGERKFMEQFNTFPI